MASKVVSITIPERMSYLAEHIEKLVEAGEGSINSVCLELLDRGFCGASNRASMEVLIQKMASLDERNLLLFQRILDTIFALHENLAPVIAGFKAIAEDSHSAHLNVGGSHVEPS
jgi:hypothetical protein